jgi:B12-binding domain/radical SAM domain protein
VRGLEYDIVFLHPPSDFNQPKKQHGDLFDVDTGYTSYFVSFPIGLLNMANNLWNEGYTTRIFNVGEMLMLEKEKFSLGRLMSRIHAKAYGIDMQWSVHAPGALDLARFVKESNPDSFVFLGGLTSTFFYEELLRDYPFIDGVMLGECDDAILGLARALERRIFDRYTVNNLAFMDNSKIIRNKLERPSLKDVDFSRYDLVEPNKWLPARANIPVVRGCGFNCPFCGGSKYSYSESYYRPSFCFLSPNELIKQIKNVEAMDKSRVYLYGDLRMAGKNYLDEFFMLLKKEDLSKIFFITELFFPITKKYLNMWMSSAPNISFTVSPESSSSKVRFSLGKSFYKNNRILDHAKLLNRENIPFSVYFLLGLPYQDFNSVRHTLKFMDKILNVGDFNKQNTDPNHKITTFGVMLYIDPASRIYRNPDAFGYDVKFKTLSDIVSGLRRPHWSYSLGYSTKWLSREQLIQAIYYVMEEESRLYLESGLIEDDEHLRLVDRINEDRRFIAKLAPRGSTNEPYLRTPAIQRS